ncbi:MAG: hypothetical protein FJ143_07475 [Deltaproteobacteria bacterium]|nr:hypothetical protein [Deltaproteobacteria bacterium]
MVTGGSNSSLEGSFLTHRRRIRELRTQLDEIDEQLCGETEKSTLVEAELAQAQERQAILRGELHRLEIERVRLEHEHRAAKSDSERLEQTVRALTKEQSDLSSTLEKLHEEVHQAQSDSESRLQEKIEREQALAAKQEICNALRQSVQRLDSEVTQSRIRNAALGEKKQNTHHNLENRLKLQEETGAQIESRNGQINEVLKRRAEVEAALVESEQELGSLRSGLQEMEERLQADRQRYRNISMNLAEIDETIKELRPLSESCQEERNRVQLQLAEKRINFQHVADNLREKYDVDLMSLIPLSANEAPVRDDLVAEIEDLRSRLERMGEVNLAAIGEYEELTTRFQFMSQQKDDLEKSIADLQQTIVKLNRICRLRFKETFEAINEKFEAIFPRLFRGGKAKLVLTDENDYLETGIDIVVQPPGKKLQSISLLSGGEKALTAVSLLFAIFLTKPSPFCFLDEVDAPLDDANVDRFNEMIKEMSEHSQFVMVTHNKKTMQAAEMLYGITMAEPGVSKVVSVRMQ